MRSYYTSVQHLVSFPLRVSTQNGKEQPFKNANQIGHIFPHNPAEILILFRTKVTVLVLDHSTMYNLRSLHHWPHLPKLSLLVTSFGHTRLLAASRTVQECSCLRMLALPAALSTTHALVSFKSSPKYHFLNETDSCQHL